MRKFIDYLNSAHESIKFTYKWSKHEIDFLDVKALNESGMLETDVFIKPTDVINIYIPVLVIRVPVKEVSHLPRR